MTRLLALLLLAVSPTAVAIVIRHDVDASRYQAHETEFPALVDLPHEGHGVLIAPQWIVTAAHATQWHPVDEVMLNGRCRTVERLFVHPGYKKLLEELQSGDAARTMEFLASSDDIALIRSQGSGLVLTHLLLWFSFAGCPARCESSSMVLSIM